MNRIRKEFKTLTEAENFQNDLYDKYEYVRLVRAPLFCEEGMYVWEVSE